MPKREAPLSELSQFMPQAAAAPVMALLQQYKVHLTITRARRTLLGDYRNAGRGRNHRISVNGNLNQYAFLITLLHELAHLLTWEQYGHRVQSHGREWKNIYGQLLAGFIAQKIFPADIEQSLLSSLHNPAASSCAEEGLMRVLRRYDPPKSDAHKLVEEVAPGACFRIEGGRVFKKGEKMRKRYRCTEIATGKIYLFSAVYEVEEV
jgi:SprT protein